MIERGNPADSTRAVPMLAHQREIYGRPPRQAHSDALGQALVWEVQTARASYRVRGSDVGADLLGPGRGILVALERLTLELPSQESLRERYGLSRKEAEVALLVVQGKRNEEIAARLHISPHTARHHTELVRLKLEVKSRAEVGAKILRG